MRIIANTHIGNVRKVNQDCVQYHIKDNNECIIVVCDGMGGHKAGEVASYMSVKYIIDKFIEHPLFHEDEIQNWISDVINQASYNVKLESYKSSDYEGMGTTCVVCVIKNHIAYISHVGDSRAYYIDSHILEQLTADDTLVNALVIMGSISKEDAKIHPKKNVLLQAVGVNDELNISFMKKDIKDGILLVCTDGLYNSLSDDMLLRIIDNNEDISLMNDCLIHDALKYGGHDNIGYVIMKYKGEMQ